MSVDKERLFKKLDHVGEHVVRENLERGVYGPNRRPYVEEWLEQFEEAEEALAAELAHEHDTRALGSADDSVDSSEDEAEEKRPRRKWYQRLFGRGSD